ncbi:hypothetical protein AB0F81_24375 [Actinoplanes sp. NPDC024001]|uniref:hypothetical protein n=1 Tax=Actinoplanes sp. NPDC024001 TaxID=3154598 RepID=UPI00340C1778
MGESVQPAGEVHVLGESKVWPAVLIPIGAAAVLVAVSVTIGSVPWYGAALLAIGLLVAVARRGNAVLADDEGLLIRGRGGLRRSYAWAQIDRMGWQDTSSWARELVVYPRGEPYDVPGPNSPARPGRIWRWQRRPQADPLPGLRDRYGIKSLLDP